MAISDYDIKEALLIRYRNANPKSRACRLVRFYLNTSRRQQEQCILCEECGPTWASQWPKTVTAENWRIEHIAQHVENARQFLNALGVDK